MSDWRADFGEAFEAVQAEIDKEPPPTIAPLPPYDHDRPCPKCRFIAGTTDYQSGWHSGCAVPEAPLPVYASYGPFDRQWFAAEMRTQRIREAIPEHFERTCPNCKYEWAESVIEEGE